LAPKQVYPDAIDSSSSFERCAGLVAREISWAKRKSI